MGYCTGLLWHRLIFGVHNDCIETISWLVSYYYILVQMDEMLISSKCLLRSIRTCYCIKFMLLKLLGKYYQTVTHILFYYSTIYMIILSTLLLLSPLVLYCHRIVPVIEITWILIDLNNNIKRQLTLGLKKLMEEIASAFWVDVGYRLRNRLMIPLQLFREMIYISYCLLLLLTT